MGERTLDSRSELNTQYVNKSVFNIYKTTVYKPGIVSGDDPTTKRLNYKEGFSTLDYKEGCFFRMMQSGKIH